MKPKEKALELIKKFTDQEFVCISDFGAKQCALISVDEMLFELHNFTKNGNDERFLFWNEVKNEITNL